VLIGALLVAEETQRLRLAAVLQACRLLHPASEPEAPESAVAQARKTTLRYLQRTGPKDV